MGGLGEDKKTAAPPEVTPNTAQRSAAGARRVPPLPRLSSSCAPARRRVPAAASAAGERTADSFFIFLAEFRGRAAEQ